MLHMSRFACATAGYHHTERQNEVRPICAGRASEHADPIHVMRRMWPEKWMAMGAGHGNAPL